MNFDDKIKRALGKSKTNLPKFIFPKLNLKPKPKFGASLGMQKKWASFNSTKRSLLRKRLPDTDGDRVPNKFDCNPFNIMRQDTAWKRVKLKTPQGEFVDKQIDYYKQYTKENATKEGRRGKIKGRKIIKGLYENKLDKMGVGSVGEKRSLKVFREDFIKYPEKFEYAKKREKLFQLENIYDAQENPYSDGKKGGYCCFGYSDLDAMGHQDIDDEFMDDYNNPDKKITQEEEKVLNVFDRGFHQTTSKNPKLFLMIENEEEKKAVRNYGFKNIYPVDKVYDYDEDTEKFNLSKKEYKELQREWEDLNEEQIIERDIDVDIQDLRDDILEGELD